MNDARDEKLMRVWVRLMRSGQRLRKAVETDLKTEGYPPLLWYDVLLELERAGAIGLRQRDIQRHTLLERYNVSRLVDRLEAEGLVSRGPAGDDARGSVVCIAAKGTDLRQAMWPIYVRAVRSEMDGALSDQDLERLAGLLDRV